jgi:pimeloyl-ACP methyl ester carboxylesterase
MTANIAASDAVLLQAPLRLLAQAFVQQEVALPNGDSVSVRRCGLGSAAAPVVLLHGISSGAASWLHVALCLGEHTEVIAWDAPGYGNSTPLPHHAPTDRDYAERLHGVLLALGLRRCVLVGHSLGALMAAAYVRLYAGEASACQVTRLVLISPAGGYGGVDQAEKRAWVRQERQVALENLGIAGLAERTARRLLSPQASPEALAWVRWNAGGLQPAGYLQAIELLCESDLGLSAPASVPVTVYCGDSDIVTPPAACEAWAQAFAAPFALLPQAGHASPTEQPQAVAQAIAKSLVVTLTASTEPHQKAMTP